MILIAFSLVYLVTVFVAEVYMACCGNRASKVSRVLCLVCRPCVMFRVVVIQDKGKGKGSRSRTTSRPRRRSSIKELEINPMLKNAEVATSTADVSDVQQSLDDLRAAVEDLRAQNKVLKQKVMG